MLRNPIIIYRKKHLIMCSSVCAYAYQMNSASGETLKVALITGITGQDGSYLAEFLLKKGYIVHGIIRRSSSFNTGRLEYLYEDPHVTKRRIFHAVQRLHMLIWCCTMVI